MGNGAVKAWDKHMDRSLEVGDCLGDINSALQDEELVIKKCDELFKHVTIWYSSGAKKGHLRTFVDKKGSNVIGEVLRFHKSEMVMRSAFRVLAALALDEHNSDQMRALEVKDIVMQVVKENADDEFLVADGKRIFHEMYKSIERMGYQNIMESRTTTKMIGPILQAMRKQQRNRDLHYAGVCALHELCRDPEVAQQVMDVDGGPKQLLLSLAIYNEDPQIQYHGFGALNFMAKSAKDVCIGVCRAGAIAVIARNLTVAEQLDKYVVQQAIWALNEIAKVGKNMERLRQQKIGLIMRRCQRILTGQDGFEERRKFPSEISVDDTDDLLDRYQIKPDEPETLNNDDIEEIESDDEDIVNSDDDDEDEDEKEQHQPVLVKEKTAKIQDLEECGFNHPETIENEQVSSEERDEDEPKLWLLEKVTQEERAKQKMLVFPIRIRRLMQASIDKNETEEEDLFTEPSQQNNQLEHDPEQQQPPKDDDDDDDEEEGTFAFDKIEVVNSFVQLEQAIQQGHKEIMDQTISKEMEAKRKAAARFKY